VLVFVKVDGISAFSRYQYNCIAGYCGGARGFPHGFIMMKISLILCMLYFVTLTWYIALSCICFILLSWQWWSYERLFAYSQNWTDYIFLSVDVLNRLYWSYVYVYVLEAIVCVLQRRQQIWPVPCTPVMITINNIAQMLLRATSFVECLL